MSKTCNICGGSILLDALIKRLKDVQTKTVSNYGTNANIDSISELLDSILNNNIPDQTRLRIDNMAEKYHINAKIIEALYQWITWGYKALRVEIDHQYLYNGQPEVCEEMKLINNFLSFFCDVIDLYINTDNNIELTIGESHVKNRARLTIRGSRAKNMLEVLLTQYFPLTQESLSDKSELQTFISSVKNGIITDYHMKYQEWKIHKIQLLHHYITCHIGKSNYASLIAELLSITGVQESNQKNLRKEASNIRKIISRSPLLINRAPLVTSQIKNFKQ